MVALLVAPYSFVKRCVFCVGLQNHLSNVELLDAHFASSAEHPLFRTALWEATGLLAESADLSAAELAEVHVVPVTFITAVGAVGRENLSAYRFAQVKDWIVDIVNHRAICFIGHEGAWGQ